MKALSVRQPWAWAIIHGGKPVENRTWPTAYRGPLLIHAGQKVDGSGWNWMLRHQEELGIRMPGDDDLKLGGFIGIVDLVDCVKIFDSPWFVGPCGFVLQNPRPIELVPFKGMLGLFEVPEKVLIEALHRCPQCGESLIYANIGDGTVDIYCEECGWPDENRAATEDMKP